MNSTGFTDSFTDAGTSAFFGDILVSFIKLSVDLQGVLVRYQSFHRWSYNC